MTSPSGLDAVLTLSQRQLGVMQPRPSATLHVGGDIRVDGDAYRLSADGSWETLGPPAGSLQMFAGAAAPGGWLLCNGQTVSRTVYARLFTAIGTAWGVGDGSTTFTLPDLRGRVGVGVSATHAMGTSGGEELHTLTAAEMPQHNHVMNETSHSHSIYDPRHQHTVDPNNDTYSLRQTDSTGTQQYATAGSQAHTRNVYLGATQQAYAGINGTDPAATGITTQVAGSNGTHNNMQPFVSVNYIVKT